ncbi:hypothetical protein HYW21_00265 [Candidatus Woesearchaeota archaeon]|nr:hypothetical protein [Candidatus Woesearchaeota archaeon]
MVRIKRINPETGEEEEVHEGKTFTRFYHYPGTGLGFPLLLLLIGGYFLAKSQGWIPADSSIWPYLLIGIGSWMLFKRILFLILRNR